MIKWYTIAPRFFQTLSFIITRPFLKRYCQFEVRGFEHIKDLKQGIFAVNHASEFDPIVMAAALGIRRRLTPLFFVTGPMEWFVHERFGWRRHFYKTTFFRSMGAYSIVPGQHEYAKSLTEHVELLAEGQTVVIFPEGKLSKDGTIGEARGGVTYLGIASGVPVIPVAITGTLHLSPHSFFRRKHKITVEFGTPRDAATLLAEAHATQPHNPYKGAATKIMDEVRMIQSRNAFRQK